jgi:hypothetical protein
VKISKVKERKQDIRTMRLPLAETADGDVEHLTLNLLKYSCNPIP